MTVRELIEKLITFDQENHILVRGWVETSPPLKDAEHVYPIAGTLPANPYDDVSIVIS